jgi:hypothetical protein
MTFIRWGAQQYWHVMLGDGTACGIEPPVVEPGHLLPIRRTGRLTEREAAEFCPACTGAVVGSGDAPSVDAASRVVLVFRMPRRDGVRWVYLAELPDQTIMLNHHGDLAALEDGLRAQGCDPRRSW